MDLTKELFSMQDKEYRGFHSRLMPTVAPETIIGIRVPILRKFAKEFKKRAEYTEFIHTLPHKYYEENNLHAFTVALEKDFDTALAETKRFLPYIDNWATCDMFMPKVFAKHKDRILPEIRVWLKSGHTYTVRYAIGLLMSLFLDEDFKPEYMELVAAVRSEDYYINMMTAWYFATALAKQREFALRYITDERLDTWTHNKTIQKACESNRIDKEFKLKLRALKKKV